ncbi:MAG: hypothetical protein UT50_C0001G0083 [Candidatus Moranbacteria bacterium GW2011_GWA2_39_41]|nr:MAG: hypothetical protein UT50_C0001G0083 [Candidatus Moranbacteria bacterium GW2011_GWA2_39_41]
MENRDINVFVISYNRLKYLAIAIDWLEQHGFEKIHIVDNNSTYPPLIEYLDASTHDVHRLKKNFGHLVVWECEKFSEIIDNEYYIVTDFDILPAEECPRDVASYFKDILDSHGQFTKVGFALKIDDLPEHYDYKENVLEWESQFWKNKIADGLFDASIDTTFAMYRPGIYPSQKKWWRSIRTDFPYIARHLPWYEKSGELGAEDRYYQKHISNRSSFWSVTDVNLLRKYNNEIQAELDIIYASVRWQILQVIYKTLIIIFRREQFRRKIGKKQKIFTADISDIRILQKYNKELVQEIGTIYASGGWRFFERLKKFRK